MAWFRSTLLFVALGVQASCSSSFDVVDRPIPFTDARIDATRQYASAHYGEEMLRITPRIIVLHWTAIATTEDSYGAFVPESLPGSRSDISAAGDVNVSIHFLVDPDGKVFRLMPETWMARHVIGLNNVSIGVENVGGAGSVDTMTNAQIDANVQLVRYLADKYPTVEYLIGHHEYRLFESHPLWAELDPDYRTEKVDPGDRFMAAVRRRISDLSLKGPDDIRTESTRNSPR